MFITPPRINFGALPSVIADDIKSALTTILSALLSMHIANMLARYTTFKN